MLLIKNKGELNAPLVIAGMSGDSICSEKWEDGFEGEKWINAPPGNYSEIRIDPDHKMSELFKLNNNMRTSGIFRRTDPLQLRFLYTIDDPDRRSLIYFPVFYWNRADGFMAGVAINNGTLIPKPVEYFVIPLYTFSSHGFSGYGKISFNITPFNSFIRLATFSLEGEQFGTPGNQNFRKASIGSDLYFRSGKMVNRISHKVFGYYIAASDLPQILQGKEAVMRSYVQAGYLMEKSSVINPYSMLIGFETGKSFLKTSLELNYKLSYNGKNSGLESRFFAGAMLKNGNNDPLYGFSPGGRSGRELYLYQGVYPDRFGEFPTTLGSRQMTLSEGGLVTPVNGGLGYSRYMCSLSLTSSLPGKAASNTH